MKIGGTSAAENTNEIANSVEPTGSLSNANETPPNNCNHNTNDEEQANRSERALLVVVSDCMEELFTNRFSEQLAAAATTTT